MIYQFQSLKNQKIYQMYKKAMKELNEFFEINWVENTPNIYIFPDRKAIDMFKGYKTKRWMAGWAEVNNIYLLGPENYEAESIHKYSNEEYFMLIKHELSHLFFNVLSFNHICPTWL